MPHCKFCDKQFTTWRSFAIHVQRGCQAICPAPLHLDRWCPDSVPSGMPIPPEKPPALDAVVRGSKLLSASDLQNIMHQEWGRRLLVIVGHRHWHHLRLEHAANDFSANDAVCVINGLAVHKKCTNTCAFSMLHIGRMSWRRVNSLAISMQMKVHAVFANVSSLRCTPAMFGPR